MKLLDGAKGAGLYVLAALLGGALAGCGSEHEAPRSPVVSESTAEASPLHADPANRVRRDVLLVTLDTTRRDHIGCYEGSRVATPTLKDLCERGVVLGRATAVGPVTLPAHTSMFTGLYPPQHGARYNAVQPNADNPATLAERLLAEGYSTAAFVSAFVLERRFGTGNGFEHYDDQVFSQGANAFAQVANERDAAETIDATLAYLANRDASKPVFVWVHLFDPHAPYEQRDADSGADDAARYAAEVSYVDAQLGRLFAAPALDLDQALVMVLADHGESLGAHGERTHGLFVYEPTVSIPWIVAAPGLRDGGAASDALVSQVDLLPTVLDLLGMPKPEGLDGRSMLEPARGEHESVYIETALPYFDFGLAPLHALRTRFAKRIEAPRPEYYQLDSDPAELNNLLESGAADPLSDRLTAELDALLTEIPPLIPPAAERNATAERLRSLGYLGGTDLGMTGRDPKDAIAQVALHQAAAAAAAVGDTRSAINLLNQAEEAMPGLRSVLYLRARLKAHSGDFAGAESDIVAVNQQSPSSDSLLLLAQLLILKNRIEEAKGLLDEAARLEPGHGGVEIARGDIMIVQKDVPAARVHYRRALEMDELRVGGPARSRLARIARH